MRRLALRGVLVAVGSTCIAPIPALAQDTPCVVMKEEEHPLDERASPLDSLSIDIGFVTVKVCYGRPSAAGRTMIGLFVPYDQVWQAGANEPTMIHTTGDITLAGIRVPAGSYSLYAVPGEGQWEIIVNRSTTQWGESDYSEDLRMQEVGRAPVPAERGSRYVDTLTFRTRPASHGYVLLVLEWERVQVMIPIGP